MPDSTEKSLLEFFAEALIRHRVEFLVIGGQAEVLHGGSRVTLDVDLCYQRTADNLRRLADALKEIGVSLRGAPPGLPFRLDAEALALGCNYTFSTTHGDLDLLGYVEPIGDYESLIARAVRVLLGTTEVAVISLDDLITIRRHLGRTKDRESLAQLTALRKLAGTGGSAAFGSDPSTGLPHQP